VPYKIFVVTDWSDGKVADRVPQVMDWRALEGLMAQGAQIGSHSVTHPDFAWLAPERYAYELEESRKVIEARLGVLPTTLAIPFGQSGNWPAGAGEAARAAGYDIVYAQAENTRPAGTIPRTFVTQFDGKFLFRALLDGAFDEWEEWF